MSTAPEENPSTPDRGSRRNVVVAVVGVLAVVLVVGLVAFARRDTGPTDLPAAGEVLTCTEPPPAVQSPMSFDTVPAALDGVVVLTLDTSCGPVELTLDGSTAPQGVGNLVFLAEQGYFDDTPCHRLTVAGIFVLQCGDPTGTGTGGPGYAFGPVENAPTDDVYPAGTVAMARVGGDGESMGSQFFLVYADSSIPSDGAGGYSVLGQVTAGLDVIQSVAQGGVGPDGVAPATGIGIGSIVVEESS